MNELKTRRDARVHEQKQALLMLLLLPDYCAQAPIETDILDALRQQGLMYKQIWRLTKRGSKLATAAVHEMMDENDILKRAFLQLVASTTVSPIC